MILVSGGVVSVVQVVAAGERSALPAASVARTPNAGRPWPRVRSRIGDVQRANAEPSSEHWSRAPRSFVRIPAVGAIDAVSRGGAFAPLVSGAVVSLVHVAA